MPARKGNLGRATQPPPTGGRSILFKIHKNIQWSNEYCVCVSRSVVSDSLQHHGLQPARLLCPWDSPGKNTGVGCHSLPQGIFWTQGSNLSLPHLLHCRWILYPLSHLRSPFRFYDTSGKSGLQLTSVLFMRKLKGRTCF